MERERVQFLAYKDEVTSGHRSPAKEQESREIADHIKGFLKSGGKIQIVPSSTQIKNKPIRETLYDIMPEFLTAAQAGSRYGITRTTISAWTKKDKYPKPTKTSTGNRWRISEVEEWERAGKTPRQPL